MTPRRTRRLKATKKLRLAAAVFAAVAGPIFLSIASAPRLRAQSAAPLAFEVASIKPEVLPAGVILISKVYPVAPFRISGTRVTVRARTVNDLIQDAYDVREFQVTGLTRRVFPTGDLYDIEAKAPGDAAPTVEQVRLMLQSLLADRFQLKLHRETKQLPVYHLLIGKGGSKLKPLASDAPPASSGRSIDEFVDALSRGLDRPIIDKTGLSGIFEDTMNWDGLAQARHDDPDGFALGALSTAIQRSLGLKLESAKDQVEILVIDHVEKPSGN